MGNTKFFWIWSIIVSNCIEKDQTIYLFPKINLSCASKWVSSNKPSGLIFARLELRQWDKVSIKNIILWSDALSAYKLVFRPISEFPAKEIRAMCMVFSDFIISSHIFRVSLLSIPKNISSTCPFNMLFASKSIWRSRNQLSF